MQNKQAVIVVAPQSLDDFINLISQFTSLEKSVISVLYKRKDSWFGVIDQITYESILKRARSAGKYEIDIKIEANSHIQPVDLEELKTEVSWEVISNVNSIIPAVPETFNEAEATPLIQYRYLNGNAPEVFSQLRLPTLNITLEDLANLILQLENKAPSD